MVPTVTTRDHGAGGETGEGKGRERDYRDRDGEGRKEGGGSRQGGRVHGQVRKVAFEQLPVVAPDGC
jgi:hypothetical protein